MIAQHDGWSVEPRAGSAREELRHAGLNRFPARYPSGCCAWIRPRSRPRPKTPERASTCCASFDPKLTPEEHRPCYKQLLEVGRGLADHEQILACAPVLSPARERIPPRTSLPCAGWPCCSSGSPETSTGQTWPRHPAASSTAIPHLGTFTGPAGNLFRQPHPSCPCRPPTSLSSSPIPPAHARSTDWPPPPTPGNTDQPSGSP